MILLSNVYKKPYLHGSLEGVLEAIQSYLHGHIISIIQVSSL